MGYQSYPGLLGQSARGGRDGFAASFRATDATLMWNVVIGTAFEDLLLDVVAAVDNTIFFVTGSARAGSEDSVTRYSRFHTLAVPRLAVVISLAVTVSLRAF